MLGLFAILLLTLTSTFAIPSPQTRENGIEANLDTQNTQVLFLEPVSDSGINIRSQPNLESPILGSIYKHEIVQVVDNYTESIGKVGSKNEWVKVITESGLEGYTAAWLYQIYSGQTPTWAQIPDATMENRPATFSMVSYRQETYRFDITSGNGTDNFATPVLVVQSVNEIGTNIRQEPTTSSTVIGSVSPQDIVLVIDEYDDAIEKIGVNEQWIRIRTASGLEGYTAAWLYETYTGVLPDWIEPLTSTEDAVTETYGIPPLNEDLGPGNLGIIGEVTIPDIAPLEAEIEALNIPEFENELSPTVNGPISNLIHITITPDSETQIKSAELRLNGYSLTSFGSEPYEYDLDTQTLTSGQYRLSFSIVNSSDVVSEGYLNFEVVVQPTALNNQPVNPEVDESPLPLQNAPIQAIAYHDTPDQTDAITAELTAVDAPRLVVLNGEPIAYLDLSFDPERGLFPKPTPAVVGVKEPESLTDILTRPANLIPAPIKDALTAQHPEFWSIVIIILVAILLPQGVFTLYWMLYTWNKPEAAHKYKSPEIYSEPQHSFTAILPARQEQDVIKDTIKAIDRIEYPDHLKEILVMVRDEDDDETIAKAQEAIHELGKDNIKLITFTTGPKNKPNGLNRGLKAASKEVICVFDAEDEPHPELYNVVNTVMVRDNADVVQSGVQLMNFKSNWFSALNCLEYFFWFKSGLHCFTHALKVTPLGGNTVFFKKYWLDRIGGWDEQCLTEDADVGIRLTQLGAKIQIVYDAKHATREETPADVDGFIKQRTRWCQGFYEIFFKKDWMNLPTLRQKIAACYILLNSLLQAAILMYMPIGMYISLTQELPVPIALLSYTPIFLLLIQLLTNLIGIREFTDAYDMKLPRFFSIKMAVIYYPYQLLLAVSALRAVRRFLTKKNAWEKTAHANLHRQGQVVSGQV